MGALLDIEVVQGAAVSEVGLRLRDRRDEAVTSYADSATLGLRLSRGPGLPDETLSGGSGWSWNDADAGTVDLTIDADDTADLDPGDYTGYLTITANDVARSRPVFILHVIEGADEDAELPATYCSVRDVVDEVPWIQEVLTTLPVARRQMFAERSSARRRIDETLMSRARFALESQARAHVPVLTVDPIEPVDGVDAGPT